MRISPIIPTLSGIGCIGAGGAIAANVVLTGAAWTTATSVASVALPVIGVLLLILAYYNSRPLPPETASPAPPEEKPLAANAAEPSPAAVAAAAAPLPSTDGPVVSLGDTASLSSVDSGAASSTTTEPVSVKSSMSISEPSQSSQPPAAAAAAAPQESEGTPEAPPAPDSFEQAAPTKKTLAAVLATQKPGAKSKEALAKARNDALFKQKQILMRRAAAGSFTQAESEFVASTAKGWNNRPELSDGSGSDGDAEDRAVLTRQKPAPVAAAAKPIPQHEIDRQQRLNQKASAAAAGDNDEWDG